MQKINLTFNTTMKVLACDGFICVRVGNQAFLFEEDTDDSTGTEYVSVDPVDLSPGAKEFFHL